jgi:hypothetical protein
MQAFQGYIEKGQIIPIDMPRIPDGLQVIITVLDKKQPPVFAETLSVTKAEIDSMLENSITRSLLGSIEHPDISLEDARMERLSKYERTD